MFSNRKWVSLLSALVFPLAASAVELQPMQAHTVDLGGQTAVIYYTEAKGNYEVVTTVAANEGEGLAMRYVTTVAPGGHAALMLANGYQAVVDVVDQAGLVTVEVSDRVRYASAQ
ncbi:MAG: hypothetical protein U1F68_03905 [Gammaproteobacteria bacterium]